MLNIDTLFDEENKDKLAGLEARSAGILVRLGNNGEEGNTGLEIIQASTAFPGYQSPFFERYRPKDGSLLKLDKPISVFDNGTGGGFAYVSTAKICEDGSDVLKAYESTVPEDNQLIMICERTDNEKKTNFLGTFVLMKYGPIYKKMVTDLYNGIPHNIASKKEGSVTASLLRTFDNEIADNELILNKDFKVDVGFSKIRVATVAEIEEKTSTEEAVDAVYKSINKGIDWAVNGLSDLIEGIKFTEDDYVPKKEDNEPSLLDYLAFLVKLEAEVFEKAIDYLIPEELEKFLADTFEGVMEGLEKAGEFVFDLLPEGCKRILKSIYAVVQDGIALFKEVCKKIAEFIEEAALLFKALLMGFVNGLLSTIQTLLKLVGWLIKPSNPNKSVGEIYKDWQPKLEFIEDLIDLIADKAGEFFGALKNLFLDFSLEKMRDVLSVFVDKASKLTPYHYAYFAGSFIFEVVLGVVLAVFTGGATAVAEAANFAEKMTAMLRLIARETISVVTMGIADILQLFRVLITKFVQACKNGWAGFKQFLEKLLANKADDIARDEGRVLEKYNSKADPVEELFGAGIKSHPEEWKRIIDDLFSNDVEIIYKSNEALAYIPGSAKGFKGQIILNQDSSYSALLHEYEHFLTDKKAGFVGFEGVYNPNFRAQSEINSYGKEIEFVRNNGNNQEVLNRLKENLKEEINDFSKRIGEPTDENVIKNLQNLLNN